MSDINEIDEPSSLPQSQRLQHEPSQRLQQLQLQQLSMFSLKNFEKIDEGTKALIYLLWKNPKKPLGTITKGTIDTELLAFDTLEFEWTLLPEHVYRNLFMKLSYEQICYICGSRGMQFDSKLIRSSSNLLNKKTKLSLIDNLWKLMNHNNTIT